MVTLAHFLAVCAGNDANPFQYHLFRLLEHFAVRIIEFHRRFARIFDVLALILSNGHDLRIIQEDICRHEHRIIEKSRIWFQSFCHLVFVCMRLHEERNSDEALEYPRQFRVLRHLRLLENDGLLRINADGDIIAHDSRDILPEFVRILQTR